LTGSATFELLRDKARTFPSKRVPPDVRSLKIWGCSYRSLENLSRFGTLEILIILGYPDTSLAAVGSLRNLRYLALTHLPQVQTLAPLSDCMQLETLSLATLPSWDASGRTLEVETLLPLQSLRSLRHLELLGVVTAEASLRPLEALSGLRSARFSKYPAAEVARFYATTGVANAANPVAA
jgi:hypothetical protein